MSRERTLLPADEDHLCQTAILYEVLQQFPVTLTVVELARTLAGRNPCIRGAEPWEQAIKELCGDGLLRQNGEVVEPTLAAIRANALLDVTV